MSDEQVPFICLDQLLKLRGIATTGGQAKVMIQGGQVRVNGDVETRRGRKLRAGDEVSVGEETIRIDAELLAGKDEAS